MKSRTKVTQMVQTYSPSDAAHMIDRVVLDIVRLKDHFDNHVGGMFVGYPWTNSAQATGPSGVTSWRVNIAPGYVVLDGELKYFDPQEDYEIHAGSNLLATGEGIWATIVAKNDGGTVSLVNVKGAPNAFPANAQRPTDSEIQAAVGADVPWLKLFSNRLWRNGDTAVTQSFYDNSVRPILGVSCEAGFGVY